MVKFGRGFWREEGKQTKFNRDFLMSPQWMNWKYIKQSRLLQQKAMQSHHSTVQIFQETPWGNVQKTEKPTETKRACQPPLCRSPSPTHQGLFCGTCCQASKVQSQGSWLLIWEMGSIWMMHQKMYLNVVQWYSSYREEGNKSRM